MASIDSLPKDNDAYQPEQPPAYTPASRSIIDSLAAYFTRHAQRPVPDSRVSISGGLVDDDDLEELSPISLRISTHVNVARDGNIIALPCSPAEQANTIAKAVVETIQGQDWASGLPMIDENGRPRPIKLEVDAGITVGGSANVIGTESIISEFLRQRTQSQKWSTSQPSRSRNSDSATSPMSPKRRRRASDLDDAEVSPYKRARSES